MLSIQCQYLIHTLIAKHELPQSFLDQSERIYAPLSKHLADLAVGKKTLIVGIQGVQGSGKSTAAAFLNVILRTEHQLKVVTTSIDDFYLSKQQRERLSKQVHPLFKVRGVPGTHDTGLLMQVLSAIRRGESFELPNFDKAIDDRALDLTQIDGEIDILILEGWCVGLGPQEPERLNAPVNDLERCEDRTQIWRRTVNAQLEGEYSRLFEQIDCLITLQAPGFDSVYNWRLQQEQKLIENLKRNNRSVEQTLNAEQIKRFIAHFERLSRHALESMPAKADFLLKLNACHNIESLSVIKRS